MALKRVWDPSPNYSSRGGAGVRLVIVHTAEGARTAADLGNYFGSASSQVSSHTGIDDTPGKIWEYVKPPQKAWTAADFNPVGIQAELCAFASWSRETWYAHDTMLTNCALWIAEECKRYGLPIVKLSAGQAQGSGRGICGHVDLGSRGGGHTDPGPNFPWGEVIERAKGGGKPKPKKAFILRAPLAIYATGEGGAMPPEYTIKDDSGSDGKGNRYGVWPSGIVRRIGSAEWNYLKEIGGISTVTNTDTETGTNLLNADRAIRGLVKERD